MTTFHDREQQLRLIEAILFSSPEPVGVDALALRLPDGTDVPALLADLSARYEGRGVGLRRVADKWAIRTAEDLAPHLKAETVISRKLSRAAVETLAIVAYHQPVTRAEVEEIRGVAVSKGTMDLLLEAAWIRPVGRRRSPGRPVTWGTTEAFLDHFGLETLDQLPGVEELRDAGLLERRAVLSDHGGLGDDPDLFDSSVEDAGDDPLADSNEWDALAEDDQAGERGDVA